MSNKASMGQTIIEGGHIRTSLIEAEKLAAKLMSVDQIIVNTSLMSANYVEGETGFMIDGKTENAHFYGGFFDNIQISGKSIFKGQIISGPLELTNDAPTG